MGHRPPWLQLRACPASPGGGFSHQGLEKVLQREIKAYQHQADNTNDKVGHTGNMNSLPTFKNP